jgi:hypothetical protein
MATYYIQRDLDNLADFWSCEIADRIELFDGRVRMGQDCKELENQILLLEMGVEVLGQYTPITTTADQENNHITEEQLGDFIEFITDELDICPPKKGNARYTRRSLPVGATHFLLQENTNHILLEGGDFIILEEYHGDPV